VTVIPAKTKQPFNMLSSAACRRVAGYALAATLCIHKGWNTGIDKCAASENISIMVFDFNNRSVFIAAEGGNDVLSAFDKWKVRLHLLKYFPSNWNSPFNMGFCIRLNPRTLSNGFFRL
jgi:hypothetical protein